MHLTGASAVAEPTHPELSQPVEFVEAFTMTEPTRIGEHDWPFGGISGIDAFGDAGGPIQFYAVSDDRAEFAPARMGHLIVTGLPDHSDPVAGALTELTDEHGDSFDEDHVDPEGVRIWPGTRIMLWSSEGRTKEGEPPAVFVRHEDGATTRLPLPSAFVADARRKREQSHGVRNNRGFEALAFEQSAANAAILYAGIEEPLAQDESDSHSVCRVLRYELSRHGDDPVGVTAHRSDVVLYPLGPPPDAWVGEQNGLTELLSIGNGALLALERAERLVDDQPRYNVRLYRVTTAGAAPVPDREPLGSLSPRELPQPMSKTLVFDFDAIADRLPGGRPMNFEGMTLLPDGTLLVCSDNDHGEEGPTVFVRLRMIPNLIRP